MNKYLVVNLFVRDYTLGLLPTQINNSLFGNEEEYLDPMGISSFLESKQFYNFVSTL